MVEVPVNGFLRNNDSDEFFEYIWNAPAETSTGDWNTNIGRVTRSFGNCCVIGMRLGTTCYLHMARVERLSPAESSINLTQMQEHSIIGSIELRLRYASFSK